MTTITQAPARRPPSGAARGIVLFMLAGLCFALCDAVVKYLARRGYDLIQISWARYFFAMLVTLALVPRAYALRAFIARRPLWQLGRGVLVMLVTVLFFVAITHMPLTDAQAFSFTSPLLVTALGAVLLGERVGWRRWTAVAVGFAGVIVVAQPGQGALHWAAAAALLMAVLNALSQIMTRVISRADAAFTTALYGAVVGTLCLSIAVPFVWRAPDPSGWMLLVTAGIGGGVGHYFLAASFAHAPASTLAPYMYLQIVWAAITGYLIFNEVPGWHTAIGAAVIVASGIYVFMREAKLRRLETGG